MKRFLLPCLLLLSAVLCAAAPFQFAQLSDIHISLTNQAPLQDLRRSIDEISANPDIAFVIISGDITEAGDRACMEKAKAEFDRLPMPYYVTSGNHETTWSESGCTAFDKVYGSSRFAFSYEDFFFLGFNTGPALKMMDGHVSPQDIAWCKQKLDSVKRQTPDKKIIVVTHYPLQEGDVDNWYDVTDALRQYNVQCVLGGHYHRNLLYAADDIPNVLARSNLRGKADTNGYTIVSVSEDSISWQEKVIGQAPELWLTLPLGDVSYPEEGPAIRPSYEVNKDYPRVQEVWTLKQPVAFLEAPAVGEKAVFFGDDKGMFWSVNRKNGRLNWIYQTGSRIKCAPALFDGKVVFGSTDGNIYCLSENTGRLQWKFGTGAAVMGCPLIARLPNGLTAVLIGGSDHVFRAIDIQSGQLIWSNNEIGGYVVARPCVYQNKVYFGAWDCYLYALDLLTGKLAWKWSNGHPSDKYSPAAVWPVASNGKVFIVAPDRVFTCLNAKTGEVIYRTKEHKVRESIGIAADGQTVYSRCMNDSVLAMDAKADYPLTLWKTNAGYGYDHNPSMMIEAGDVLIFGTKNGLLHGVAARPMKYNGKKVKAGTVLWKHRIGSSVINTVYAVSPAEIYVTTTGGIVSRLKVK